MKMKPILHVMRFIPVMGMREEFVVQLEELEPEQYLPHFKKGRSYPVSTNGGESVPYTISDIREIRMDDTHTDLHIVLLPDSAWDMKWSN